jgi:hypothetical protein
VKVLVVPEDQELDRYIVQPVVQAIFSELGRRADIAVLPEPRLRGASQALDAKMIAEIVDKRPMFELVLLIVDRDCNREKNVEKAAAREREHSGKLIACLAIEEIEVWLLGLYSDRLPVSFAEVRKECDPKELYAALLLRELGTTGPGKGRKAAMRALAGQWRGLCSRCPEIVKLRDQIARWLEDREAA